MAELTRTLATLTGQGWQITQHGYGQVVLSRPYPNRWHLASWNVGMIMASMILLCVAAKVPTGGAILLSAVSVVGMVWAVVSMVRWRRPILVLRLWRDRQGGWQQSGPKLEKG